MKKLMLINLLATIIFVIMLKISGACIVAFPDGSYGWPKIYGMEFSNIEIAWQVVLIIIIALMIIYLITLFMMLLKIVKFKKLSLKLSKSQLILIFSGLFLVIASITVTVFEREESVIVGGVIGGSHSPNNYKYIVVDETNKGYVILEKFNEETTRMKASSKAIEAVNRANSKGEERGQVIFVSYRKNILLNTEYKISGIAVAGDVNVFIASKEHVYYMQYFRRRMDYGIVNPSHYKIYDKYLFKDYYKERRKKQNK